MKLVFLLCLFLFLFSCIAPPVCDQEVVVAECTDDNSTTYTQTTHENFNRVASSSRRTSRCTKTVKQNNECKNEFDW